MTNLDMFTEQINKAYAVASAQGHFSAQQSKQYGLALRDEARGFRRMPRLRIRRKIWRNKIAKMANKELNLGQMPSEINWGEIWQWILENIIPILQKLLPLMILFI